MMIGVSVNLCESLQYLSTDRYTETRSLADIADEILERTDRRVLVFTWDDSGIVTRETVNPRGH